MREKIIVLTALVMFLAMVTPDAQALVWWNDSWNERVNITIQDLSGHNHSYEYVTVAVTDSDIDNCDSLRLLNDSCDVAVSEMPMEIVVDNAGSNSCTIGFQTNQTASTNTTHCLYFDNTTVVGPSATFPVINNTVGSGSSLYTITTDSIKTVIEDGGVINSFETDADSTEWVSGGRIWVYVAGGGTAPFHLGASGLNCTHSEDVVTAKASCESADGLWHQNLTFYKEGYYYKINVSMCDPLNTGFAIGIEQSNLHGTTSPIYGIASNVSNYTNTGNDGDFIDLGYAGYYSTNTTWQSGLIWDETQSNYDASWVWFRPSAWLNSQIGSSGLGNTILNASLCPIVYYDYIVNTTDTVNASNWNATYLNAYSWLIENPSQTFVGSSESLPVITIHAPITVVYPSQDVYVNVSADRAISTWLYNLNGSSNSSLTPNTTINTSSDGWFMLTVWANDSADVWGTSSVEFGVDTIPPNITVTNPQATEYYLSTMVSYNISFGETVNQTSVFLNSNLVNTSDNVSSLNGYFTIPSVGSYNFTVYARDDSGNTNSEQTTFTVRSDPALQQQPILLVIPLVVALAMIVTVIGSLLSGLFDLKLIITAGMLVIVSIVIVGVMYVI